jgi:hypothetical protein
MRTALALVFALLTVPVIVGATAVPGCPPLEDSLYFNGVLAQATAEAGPRLPTPTIGAALLRGLYEEVGKVPALAVVVERLRALALDNRPDIPVKVLVHYAQARAACLTPMQRGGY